MWSFDTSRQDVRELASDHENEADTRIVLHARDAAARGYKQVNILCRDTDVIVLLLAHLEQLCQEIWMFSGSSRQRRYIPYQFAESRSPRRRGSRFRHFMPILAVIRQASSMVWERPSVHRKSSKMHLTSWNTLEKKAKSELTFLPKLKPSYTNSIIREQADFV